MVEAFRWILPGRLAGSGMPGLFNPLESDLEYIRDAGIRHVVSLTEHPIPADSGGEPSFHHFPIDDMGIPTPRRASEICDFVLAAIERQEPVLIHCKAGLGRTGTLLACCLITMGSTPQQALVRLRGQCSYYVQNQTQEGFLDHYAKFRRRSRPAVTERPPKHFDEVLEALIPALDEVSNGVTLASTSEDDMPLVYVNQAFGRMTGYTAAEALGRNCRFLQGPETDPEAVARIRSAIRRGDSCHLCLRNYRKDGTHLPQRAQDPPGRPGRQARLLHRDPERRDGAAGRTRLSAGPEIDRTGHGPSPRRAPGFSRSTSMSPAPRRGTTTSGCSLPIRRDRSTMQTGSPADCSAYGPRPYPRRASSNTSTRNGSQKP